MCEPRGIRYLSGARFEDAEPSRSKKIMADIVDTASRYVAQLCQELGLEPAQKHTLLSHREAHDLGYASGHCDPDHMLAYIGMDMDKFREKTKNYYKNNKNIKNTKNNLNYSHKSVDNNKCEEEIKTYLQDLIDLTMDRFTFLIDGEPRQVQMLTIDGYTFVRLRDIQTGSLHVGYDHQARVISLRTR